MALCTITAGVASYWVASQQPKVYEAKSRYLVGPAIDNPNVDSTQLRAAVAIGQTYAEVATSRPIVQSVIDKLKLNADLNTFTQNVNATFIEGTMILTIQVRASDPQTAAVVANALGEALVERSPGGPSSLQAAQRQEARSQITRLQESIRSTQGEIDTLNTQIQQTTVDLEQRRLMVLLDQRRAELAASQRALSDQYAIVQGSSANQIAVVEPAVPEPLPIAPEVARSVLAALLAGLVLGLAVMLLCEYFMDVLYLPDDLRKVSGLAYLGGIARHRKLRGNGLAQLVLKARPETLAAESYRILRANLQMPNSNRALPSLLITSPSRGDGKSEIAANLAISFAQAGKRVILVDANLRRPRLAALFEVPDQDGLSSLLEQPAHLPQPILIPSIPNLAVLPSGAPTANSSEILASRRMSELLHEFKSQADIVILDSPPLLYSDALALAPQVDGVLLVANSGATGRQQTAGAVESLRLVGANLIGTVLNRVKPGAAYNYYPMHAKKPSVLPFATPAPVPTLNDAVILQNGAGNITQQFATTSFATVDGAADGDADRFTGQGTTPVAGLFHRVGGTNGKG